MKTNKKESLRQGEDQLQQLVALGHEVKQFSRYHFRINGVLDVWPSSRKFFDRRALKKSETYGSLLDLALQKFGGR